MLIMVCYDVADRRRLYRVARLLEGYGERVQASMFECHLDRSHIASLQREVAAVIDPVMDKVHYYRLCDNDRRKVRWIGKGLAPHDVSLWQI